MPRRLPRLRDPQPVAGIAPVADRRPPPAIVEIPVDRLREPAGKALLRPPAQLALDLRRVDRVAPVVPRPVGDDANHTDPTPPARRGSDTRRVGKEVVSTGRSRWRPR